MAAVDYVTSLPAYIFFVRGSTTYEHSFSFTLVETGISNPVGTIADPQDVVDAIRSAFEADPNVLDVTVEKREYTSSTV